MNADDFLKQFDSLVIKINGVRLPTFVIEDKYKDTLKLDRTTSNYDFLHGLCLQGFKTLNFQKGEKNYDAYAERVKTELGIMQELGFVDYILLVWDVINYCKENKIPTGLGRGSAAGSLVLYLIGVTKIDPIKYGLYFERFISKTRAKKKVVDGITYLDGSLMCDVDLDICYYNRPKVLKYLEEKFKGKTSKILTFNTLSSKLVIKEVGKIVGMKPEEEMTRVTGMIPKLHGIVVELEDAINGVKEKDSDKWKVAPVTELKEWCNANPRVYTNVLKIKDLIKNKGVHPSGILISHDELDECCPTELSSDKDIVSGYDMNWVSLFTVKLDALGLRGVSVVDDICKMLKIQVEDIDLNHPSIYENLQNLKYPHGLFQIEADLGFKTTQKVQPHNFNELSAILALARPGASQFIDRYAGFTNGQDYEKVHPFFDDILKETGSLCLYQEQAMQMANKIGFSLDESEQIRRCISKKKIDEIKLWEDKIKHKIDENKLDSKIGDVFWKILNDSSGYQFNKSHSYSYAALTAITVYLKFNYPTEFYLSLLKMSQHEPDPISEIAKIHKEMIHIGICLLPPSLAKSNMDFSVEGSDIRFGLSSIKGIAGKTIEKLNDFKREHANKFELFESSKEAGLDIGVLSALIQAGTLDGFGKTRTHLVYEAQLWNLLKPREKQKSLELGKEYNFYLPTLIKALNTTIKDEKGKSFIKDSRFETIKKNSAKYKLIYQQNKICESFANWWYEKRLLGYAIYTTLREIFMDKKSSLIPVTQVLDLEEGRYCDFIGFIEEEPKSGLSKNKNKYSKMVISDETGSIKVMIFSDSLDKCKDTNGKMPSEEDIVIVKGKKMGKDTIFANEIAIQQNQIYTKLSDLKGDTGELKL